VAPENFALSWDEEYRRGRYRDEPPLPFASDIVSAVRARPRGSGPGLYIGCGNGRNYLPLRRAGLDLIGLDLSRVALDLLAEREESFAEQLVHGDLRAIRPGHRFPLVLAIQVLQHGDESTSHRLTAEASERVAPGGLLCIRVNAVGTDVEHAHDRFEDGPDGRFSVRYQDGPKQGLTIHFYAEDELCGLVGPDFRTVLPVRRVDEVRAAPRAGRWCQWEGIWERVDRADGARVDSVIRDPTLSFSEPLSPSPRSPGRG
jgi:SAM-dependent methyltransferase